jgi:hypothetical protein
MSTPPKKERSPRKWLKQTKEKFRSVFSSRSPSRNLDTPPTSTSTNIPPINILELRINSPSVRLYPVAPLTITDDILAAAAMIPGADSPSAPSTCLLRGPLDDFLRYSRQEASKWLIDIAHDICDPADHRGSLLVWKELRQQWCPVATTDPLTASTYRYDLPVGITVGPSKISQRVRTSVTTTTTGYPNTMADRVKGRDGECWVTGGVDPLVNSRIVPKRMGDHLGRIVFRTFTSLPHPLDLSIYNEIFSLCLMKTLDAWFGKYEMGLRFVSPVRSPSPLIF